VGYWVTGLPGYPGYGARVTGLRCQRNPGLRRVTQGYRVTGLRCQRNPGLRCRVTVPGYGARGILRVTVSEESWWVTGLRCWVTGLVTGLRCLGYGARGIWKGMWKGILERVTGLVTGLRCIGLRCQRNPDGGIRITPGGLRCGYGAAVTVRVTVPEESGKESGKGFWSDSEVMTDRGSPSEFWRPGWLASPRFGENDRPSDRCAVTERPRIVPLVKARQTRPWPSVWPTGLREKAALWSGRRVESPLSGPRDCARRRRCGQVGALKGKAGGKDQRGNRSARARARSRKRCTPARNASTKARY
jgi:hypothetical protein